VLQMTVSRYHTPSGRVIQTPYEDGDLKSYYALKTELHDSLSAALVDSDAFLEHLPDSLKYRTEGGRPVFGGGGILPDYVIQPDSASPFVAAVIRKGVDFFFMRDWFDRNEQALRDTWAGQEDVFVNTFTVDDAMWESFLAFAAEKDIETTDDAAAAEEEGVFLRSAAETQRETISTRIKAYLARQLYSPQAWYPVIHTIDRDLDEAMKLWDRANELVAYELPER
jgi:carboxyl-terminal processing protease